LKNLIIEFKSVNNEHIVVINYSKVSYERHCPHYQKKKTWTI